MCFFFYILLGQDSKSEVKSLITSEYNCKSFKEEFNIVGTMHTQSESNINLMSVGVMMRLAYLMFA